jgi:uroporphyrinogen decarboxylase
VSKPLLDVLQKRKPSRIPLWLMRQAGRYLPEYRQIRKQARDFLDLCYAPALATEVTLQPVRRFGFDAAILFADILLVPHALGQSLRFEEGEGPVLDPVKDRDALRRLQTVEAAARRLDPVYETVRRVRAALPDETALIGFAGAPWTVASYMVEGRGSTDQKAAKLWAMQDPEGFAALIGLIEEATVAYLSGQIEAGAEVIQLFESWGGSHDAAGFETWSIAPAARIVAALKRQHPDLPVIGFPRGAGVKAARYAEKTGIDALSLDWSIPLDWAVRTIPSETVLQGNLDPMALLAGGRALEERTDLILQETAGRRFIFNLGHGILPETPLGHVEALVCQLRKAPV